MADVTVNESTYDRNKRDAEKFREQERLLRQQGETAGVAALRAGKKGEALVLLGGANAPALQSVIAGAGIYWLASSDFMKDVQVFKDHWWLKPLLIMGLGYWLWRRNNPWASAVMASGAALFVQAWKSRPESKKEASGPDEAGWWGEGDWHHERPWLEREYPERGRWVEAPTGGRVFLVDGPNARAAERMAERIFEHARS